MEAWDRAKVVQEEVNGEPIANGNGAGRAKTKLMEMVVKRVMRLGTKPRWWWKRKGPKWWWERK